jgi:hypothetical protein
MELTFGYCAATKASNSRLYDGGITLLNNRPPPKHVTLSQVFGAFSLRSPSGGDRWWERSVSASRSAFLNRLWNFVFCTRARDGRYPGTGGFGGGSDRRHHPRDPANGSIRIVIGLLVINYAGVGLSTIIRTN